jgi:hypothetical protein
MDSWQYCIPAACFSLLLFVRLRHCLANGFAYGSSQRHLLFRRDFSLGQISGSSAPQSQGGQCLAQNLPAVEFQVGTRGQGLGCGSKKLYQWEGIFVVAARM